MKPDWDKLAAEYKNSSSAIVADVDCTRYQDFCRSHGVRGYPTLKYGDPSNMEDYRGGRTFADLQKFAHKNLVPLCSPGNLDLCDADKKQQIDTFMAMSDEDLASKIAEKKKELDKLEEDFQTETKALQEKYKKLEEQKEKDNLEIKNSGLSLMVSAKMHRQSLKKSSEL